MSDDGNLTNRAERRPSGLYPTVPALRRSAQLRDGAVAVLVGIFILLGVRVRDLVDNLAVLGEGLRGSGEALSSGFSSAASAVAGIPGIGGALSGALNGAGGGTGGALIDTGQAGIDAVNRLALTVGLLVALLPTAVLLVAYLPRRIRTVRERRALVRVTTGLDADADRQRFLAMRAAFTLPYEDLLRFTPDPLGDLDAGRHDRLVAAALAAGGLDARRTLI